MVTWATTTTLTAAAGSVGYGAEDTDTFTVTVAAPGAPAPPGGKVAVKTGGTTLCTVTLADGTGTCTMTATKLEPGSYGLSAAFPGAPGYSSSSAGPVTLAVTSWVTATNLALSSPSVPYSQVNTAMFTVTVTADGAPGPATGKVTVKSGGVTLCTVTLTDGTGTCIPGATKLKPGTYQLEAAYTGVVGYDPSGSAPVTFTVTKS